MDENEVFMEDTTPSDTEDTTWDGSDLFTEEPESEAEPNTTADDNAEGEAEASKAESEPEPEPENTTQPEPTVTLKYLGKDFPVPQKAAQAVADSLGMNGEGDLLTALQKGMNYDHAVENTPLHKLMAQYAEANDMTMDEYVRYLQENVETTVKQVEEGKVRTAHPEWDDEKVQMQVELNRTQRKTAKAEAERQKAASVQAQQPSEDERLKPFLDFMAAYPDVKEFPPEVARKINEDKMPPIAAYKAWQREEALRQQNEELQTKLQQAEKKNLNKAKSPGSVNDTTQEVPDDFLTGLFSG